jgi:hypothetical protein
MNEKAQKLDKMIRWPCALLLTLAAALLGFILVGLCLREIHHHKPGDDELVFSSVLAVIAALGFFPGYASWSLWRGCVSSNGVALMPTWFIQAFGVFVLVGIIYTGYCNPRWWIVAVGIVVAYGVIYYPRSLAEARRRNDRIG